jgi:hypothetical protein
VAKLTALGADAEAKVVEFSVMTRTDAIVVMA